jgi:1-acyl-sn-glycerol-3-phosphate acyltransferase
MANNSLFSKYSQNSSYRTDNSDINKNGFPSLSFFSRLLMIVIRSNRLARRGIYDDYRWVGSSIDVINALEYSGVEMNFEGLENLYTVDGPVLFIGNHMSTLETMALPSLIHPIKKVVYVIKEELSKYPLFGPIALARDPILVGRANPREDLKIVMEEGSKKIQAGKSIIIFPQKTRSQFFDSSLFNSLGVKLAKRNNIPIIPLALLTDAWGNGKIIKEVGKIDPSKKVHISFGEPITVSGNGSAEHEQVIQFISGKLSEWGRGELIVKT